MEKPKKRISAVVKFAAAVIILAAVSFTVGCPFYRLTGLRCPGCGISRMLLSIVRLDFKSAFFYNPALFCLCPLWATGGAVYKMLKAKGNQKSAERAKNALVYFSVALLVAFGILRNLFTLGFPQ